MPTAQRGTLLAPWWRRSLLLFYLLFTLSPIMWLLLSTIQTQASLLRVPVQIVPESVTLRNYIDIFKPAAFGEHRGESTFLLALRNSVLISLGTTAVAMLFGTLAAYAFARFNIPGKRGWLLTVLGSQLLPPISILIPLFRMFKRADLLDTMASLILAYSTFSIPFVVWIMAGYFQSVPVELEAQEIQEPDGVVIPFDIDPFRKHCLLNGLDNIALTLEKHKAIKDFESRDATARPWA